ncbi:hypothetical protein HanXRQr2_Chr15g0690621 [Helianthus annuus]|uniref:Uncharacterized protein n=1 Tax=Helianthus annuus TaxID=4232 RepID=A0A9K3E080_HELAN|nr:hypothetical protein HanXRQr2_Chr15g0690621 [Helianthus annuus]KAJ0831039.1 hypothetical protein HanPSC8_Chr15g0662431 [Helianthus annuus]
MLVDSCLSLDAYGACTRRRSLWDMDCYVPYLIFNPYEPIKLMF